MFVILTYDIQQKRVQRVMKICRSYLHHVQRSVFEGNLTEGQINKLKRELEKMIDVQHDAVIIYTVGAVRFANKESIGASCGISTIV